MPRALSPLAGTAPAYAFAARLVGDLVAAGVTAFCVCPGSRSAPLAAVAATTPGARVFAQLDERSAGFFAMGLARASARPVALVCTSGTAAANFLPAVAEAANARVPLLVLTADRPPALRHRGAPQTIDQVHLYGRHVRAFHEPAPPLDAAAAVAAARALAPRLVEDATASDPGPVHANLPFEEPLDPSGPGVPAALVEGAPVTPVRKAPPSPDAASLASLREALATARRPVIVAGPDAATPDEAGAVGALARTLGIPLLGEPLSGLRSTAWAGDALVASADALLRAEAFARATEPDFVLWLGAPATSKAIHRWLADHASAEVVAVAPSRARRDPAGRVDRWIEAPGGMLARALLEDASGGARRDPTWLPRWQEAEKRAWDAVEAATSGRPPMAGAAFAALRDALPDEACCVLANSLAVRDAETFGRPDARRLRYLGNRGANGIDGLLSTALGVAAHAGPTGLLTGDLAFLHDAGALFSARQLVLPLRIVVVNDGGGGIFDHLPIAACGAEVAFEETFRLAHGQSAVPIARAYGVPASTAASAEELRAGLAGEGPRLVELAVSPDANLSLHRDVWARVARAVEGVRR